MAAPIYGVALGLGIYRGLGQPWSDIFDEAKGVFSFFKTWLP
jgi:hypothetical protein